MHNEISDYLRMIDDADNAHSPTSRAAYADALIDVLRDIFTDEEIQALAQAKAEGRLVMLPCKVGDEIFSFKWSIKNEKYEVHTGKVKNVRYDSSDGLVTVSDGEWYCVFGKTVFLTYEEAEKALGGGQE